MPLRQNPLAIVGSLIVIALAATVTGLALQAYYGRLPSLVLLGQTLATTGAAPFALRLKRRP
jgi:hypothetical protein